jgi:L-rhamnose-H+ transport protein
MTPESAPLLGTLLHTIGAGSAALCYTPQKALHKWSWQTYWLVQAFFCWFSLPWIFAWIFVPELGAVLAEAPRDAMLKSYLFGVLYGVGGIAFGVSIRYIGFSLTYAIAIGISCAVGTLTMPLYKGVLAETLSQAGGAYVLGGVVLGAIAIVLTGLAGFRKERELTEEGRPTKFNARLGLPICLVAGVLSAVFSFALDAAQPVADVARAHGAGQYEGLAIYLFSNPGAFTTTVLYVLYLAWRDRSWSEFVRTRDGSPGLLRNYGLSLATGLMWYGQFFFYGLGHVRMGAFKFSSWAIHMTILILLSAAFGFLIGEWRSARRRTVMGMYLALLILFAAVGILTYGNYLGGRAAAPAEAVETSSP